MEPINDEMNYLADIQEDLNFIPQEHLATIRDMIRLIAKPYKEEAKPEENIVNKELLQLYADKFRKGFKLLMKKDLGLNISFQIEEEYTLLKFIRTPLEDEKQEIEETKFDLEEILKENDLEIIFENEDKSFKIIDLDDEEYESDYTEKQLLFDIEDENFYFLETSDPQKWTETQATKDARDLLGSMVKSLPKGV